MEMIRRDCKIKMKIVPYGAGWTDVYINFGDEEGNVKGGHLVQARISATSEIILRVVEGYVGRKLNEEIGLNLFDF